VRRVVALLLELSHLFAQLLQLHAFALEGHHAFAQRGRGLLQARELRHRH
jgi:hypothetical protein